MEHVDTWPMEKYPFKMEDGRPVSNYFKLTVLEYDGRASYHYWKGVSTDEKGNKTEVTKELQPKTTMVTSLPGILRRGQDLEEMGGQTMTPCIGPVDLRKQEELLDGKPTVVQMGLWASWDGTKWVKDDVKKVNSPRYWRDVTDEYYEKWRKAAYDGFDDPFADKIRPFTRQQEMEKKAREVEEKLREQEKLIEAQNAELKRLNEKGNK
jgi:hypothetical protein